MKNYFAVFSPKIEDYQDVEDIVYRHVMLYDKRLLVKELGRDETHPHLNFVFEAPFKMKAGRRKYMEHSNIHRRLTNIFPTDILKRNPKLLCLKKCHDSERLVNGYLRKEKSATLIECRGFKYVPNTDPVLLKEVKVLQKKLNGLLQEIRQIKGGPPFSLEEYMSSFVSKDEVRGGL